MENPAPHAAWPQAAAAVIAAIRSSVRLAASHDNACSNDELYTMCPHAICDIPAINVVIVRQSCEEEKRNGNMPLSCRVATRGRRGDRSTRYFQVSEAMTPWKPLFFCVFRN